MFPGLVISPDHDNDIEYWENEELYYMCIDPEFGVDASADRMKKYKCKKDKPKGRYNTPRLELNETWPVCQTKTTTVKPRKEPIRQIKRLCDTSTWQIVLGVEFNSESAKEGV